MVHRKMRSKTLNSFDMSRDKDLALQQNLEDILRVVTTRQGNVFMAKGEAISETNDAREKNSFLQCEYGSVST